MAKELYERLGISETASEMEIASAYRTLSAECSPESGRTDSESVRRYMELTEAYTVLSNLESRAEYDIKGTVKGRKSRRGSSQLPSIVRTRETINRIFLAGAAVSTILFIVYLCGGSPVPFYYACGISLVIKLVEYILRLVQ